MFHLVVKYCIRDRKILGYTLFGIVVSVALMYNLLLTADSILQTFIAMASEGQKYDMAFVDIGEDQQKKVEQYVAQNSCKGYLSGDFLGDIYLEDALLPTTVMGYRGDLEYIMDASLVEGSLPDSDGEICLDVSENAGLKKPYQIGDWITVKVTEDGNEEEYILKCQVSGFVDGIPLEGNYALISLEWCDRLKKSWNLSGNSFRFTQVCCKESYDEEKVFQCEKGISVSLWGEKYYKKWATNLRQNDTKEELYANRGIYKSYSQMLHAMGVVIGICIFLFIYARFSVYMWDKNKLFGTLLCLGDTKKDIFTFLVEVSFLLSLIGGIAGVLLGNIVSYIFSKKIIYYFVGSLQSVEIHQNLKVYFYTIVLVLLAVFLADFLVFVKICRRTPVQMLREGGNVSLKLPKRIKKEKLKKWKKDSVEWHVHKILKRNIFHFVQGGMLFFCMCLCMIITSMFYHMYHKEVTDIAELFPVRIRSGVSLKQWEITPGQIDQIKEIEGVQRVYSQYLSNDLKGHLEDGQPILVSIYSDDLFSLLLRYTDDQELKAVDYRNSEVSVFFAEKATKSQSVNILVDKEIIEMYPEYKEHYKIPIIEQSVDTDNVFIRDSGYPLLVINEKLAHSLGMSLNSTRIYLNLNNNCNKENIIQKIYEIFGEKDAIDLIDDDTQFRKSNILKGMMILGVYALISILIAILSIVANGIKLEVELKKQEYGLLQVFGMSRRKIIGIIQKKHINITLFSGFLSMIVAAMSCCYLCKVINVKYSWVENWINFIIILLFCALISIQCLWILTRKKESISQFIMK